MSEPRHHRCTKHVEHHFLCRTGLHSSRTCQHFRPHLRCNHDLREPRHGHLAVRGNRHRCCPSSSCEFQRRKHKRRRSAGRYSHDHVVPRQLSRAQFPFRTPHVILRPFHGLRNRPPSSANQPLPQLGGSPKPRLALPRIQHRHAPARPRSHITQPPAFLNPRHNRAHRPRNRWSLSADRDRHLAVFAVYQRDNLLRSHAVEILRGWISLFGQPGFFGDKSSRGLGHPYIIAMRREILGLEPLVPCAREQSETARSLILFSTAGAKLTLLDTTFYLLPVFRRGIRLC